VAAWCRAQQAERMRRIGVLVAYAEGDSEMKARLAAFREGLEQRGWLEGRNILIDVRFAPACIDSPPDQLGRQRRALKSGQQDRRVGLRVGILYLSRAAPLSS
jgi:hypothetical protein